MKKIIGILIFTLISIFTVGNVVFADEISEKLKTMKLVGEYGPRVQDFNLVDTIKFGSYPQNDISGVTSEPVEWFAIKREDNKVLLMSKYILDYRDFGWSTTGWLNSNLQIWMNTELFNKMFTDIEKKRVVAVINKTVPDDEDYTVRNVADSNDLLFVLACDEIQELECPNCVIFSALTNYSKIKRDQLFPDRDTEESYNYYLRNNRFSMFKYRVYFGTQLTNRLAHKFDILFQQGNDYAGIRPAVWISIDETTDNTEVHKSLSNENQVIYTEGVGYTRNGVKIFNEWVFIGGYYKYIYDSYGNQELKKGWWEGRYLGSGGEMYRAQVLPDGVRYVDDNGYLVDINVDFAQSVAKRPLTPNSWYKTDAGFYYFIEADGISTKKGWYKENGVDYYFNPDNGIMVTGYWKVQYGLYPWCYFNDVHPEEPKNGVIYKMDKPYGAAISLDMAPASTQGSTSMRDNNLIIFNRPTPEDLDNLTVDELIKKYYSPYANYGGTRTYSTKP